MLNGAETVVFSNRTFPDLNVIGEKFRVAFGQPIERVMLQVDLYPGFDEIVILAKNGMVYKALVKDGDVLEFKLMPQEVQR